MGLFHCPIGAMVYQDAVCIECGLCMAQTREEAVAASKIIREYIKSHASTRANKYLIQKIAVCGKGGVGKSTISTLLAQSLEECGYRLLVMDTDESNPSLFRSFGFDRQPKQLISILDRFSSEEETSTQWLTSDKINLEDIPKEFVQIRNNIMFMMIGKIDDPFQGCACSMADIMRDFICKLSLKEKQILLADNEAGVESFGRGIERGMDTVIIVVEPSYESMALAEKISYMAQGIGISRIRAILNKVPSEQVEEKMINFLIEKEIRYLGSVYLDACVIEECFGGQALGNSNARKKIRTIARLMLDEAEMEHN